MWLPKDERRLLSFLYSGMIRRSPGDILRFDVMGFMRALGYESRRAGTQGQCDNNPFIWRVWTALENLVERKLIQNTGTGGLREIDYQVRLALSGYDLGRKYNSRLIQSGLWFAEYKDHWFWLIISFVGGIIGALLVNWLS